VARISNLESPIQRVRRLHKPKNYFVKNLGSLLICSHCRDDKGNTFVLYPCSTIKAADGIIDVNAHKPMNGPYDNLVCEYCSDFTDVDDFVEYPCTTIKFSGGNK
jgi:hypothetical protein